MKLKKRLAALLMAASMTITVLPVNALAVETTDTDGLCEHHPAHTGECGYSGGTPGTPCTHEHSEDCYTLVTECVHKHKSDCYPAGDISDDTATPSEPEDAGPTNCTHECSGESGCITKKLDCKHEHDEDCGYSPAVPGTPCAFVCGECGQAEENIPEEPEVKCVCETLCTADAVNADCPVCGAEGADLTQCGGKDADGQVKEVQAQINTLAAVNRVGYLDEDGNQQTADSVTEIDSSAAAWSAGWYVVNRSVTISGRVTVRGKVYLILADGNTLTVSGGIDIADSGSLTIYGQKGGTGRLVAEGDSPEGAGKAGNAGINASNDGTITINGGKVEAIGGNGNEGTSGYGGGDGGAGGAGIGGENGEIIINGGEVTANGGAGGNGGGGSYSDGGGMGGVGGAGISGVNGSITITGGTVTAQGSTGGDGSKNTQTNNRIGPGGDGGAGIGGENGSITFDGGEVTATGGTGGQGNRTGAAAAGIRENESGDITISGGKVKAAGGDGSVGISVGDGGSITVESGTVTADSGIDVGAGSDITIDSGTVIATGRDGGESADGGTGIRVGANGTITINDGTVEAAGGNGGRGINWGGYGGDGGNGGTGISVGDSGSITIIGGMVNASGGKGGAGNAGSYGDGNGGNGGEGISVGDGGSITITGGKVKAVGSNGGNGAGAGNKSGTGGAGGGGIASKNSGSITITGGAVDSTGGAGGSGGSGWGKADGGQGGEGIVSESGSTTISGGTVTATGSRGGYGFNGGSGGSVGSGVGGTFSTGTEGDAVIKSSSIGDNSDKSSWSGIIFEGNSGGVYGNQTLREDLEISGDQELTIQEGSALKIPNDVTLTNKGTITNNGALTGEGTLAGSGTLTGDGTIEDTIGNDFQKESTVTVSFEGEGAAGNTVTYGSSITIKATVQQKVSTLSLQQNTVDFYLGDPGSSGKKLNENPIPVVGNTAALDNVEITGDTWKLNTYTIYAVYDGGMTMKPETGSASLAVKGDLKTADVTVKGEYVYTGSPVTPNVSVEWNGTILTSGTDYTLSYENANGGAGDLTNAGTITVTVTGTGSYTGAKTAAFTIAQSGTAFDGGVTVDQPDGIYTYGDTITVTVTPKATGAAPVSSALALLTAPTAGQMAIYEDDRQLTEAQDVTSGSKLTFIVNTAEANLGRGKHTLAAKFVESGNMAAQTGTAEVEINPASISEADVTVSGGPFTYDGNPKTPAVTVKLNGTTLTDGADYALSYGNTNGGAGNLTNAGTVTVTAAGEGNYTGTKTAAFTIGKAAAPVITWPTASGIIYGQTLSESALNGGSTEYGSFAWESPDTAPAVSNSGYLVVFIPSEATERNYETISITKQTVAVPVEKAEPKLTLIPSAAEMRGGGQVELTLTGLPEGGKAEITCSESSITLETGENNSWKASLPNINQTYTFTAAYSGDENHNAAEAGCQVVVTRRSSSGSDSDSSTVIQTDKGAPQAPTAGQTTPVQPGTSGTASIESSAVQDAINRAAAEAKENGNAENGIAVTVPIQNAKDAKSLSIIIEAQTLDELVAAKVRRFEITANGLPSFGFTLDTLKMLDTQSWGGELILRTSQAAIASAEAKEAVGTRPAYVFSLAYVKDGRETPLTDWQGKTVSVKLPYTPAENEQAGSLFAVSVDESGKVQWIVRSSYNADQKAVIFEAGHFSIYGVGCKNPVPAFTDINSHWAKDHILFTVSRGLLSGTGETAFSPNTPLTRGVFETALGRLTGIDPAPSDASAPDSSVTREQMAVIMKNYTDKMGYSIPKTLEAVTFSDDTKISSGARDAVKAMQQAGILSGKGDNQFAPEDNATRAEAAAVLHRFVEVIIDPQTANGWAQNDSK